MPNHDTLTDKQKRIAAVMAGRREALRIMRESRDKPTDAELRADHEASKADYRRDCEVSE